MTVVILLVVTALLLLLVNVFFVLAEFAAVKLRGSRIEELIEQGRPGSPLLRRINQNLDEYLSVCQVGITFASVALGFVGEPLAKELLLPVARAAGAGDVLAHTLATTAGIAVVGGLHILIGEQVPKLMAVRVPDRVGLLTARPLVWSRTLFWPALFVLNGTARLILRWLGLRDVRTDELHSEDELRIILDRSQEEGVLSFRRLLFMENVFDFGDLKVRDAMRPRSQVKVIDASAPWEEALAVLAHSRFSRYPLITSDPERPSGMLHVKDLLLRRLAGEDRPPLASLSRPLLAVPDTAPLEALLADMQRRRVHAAVVLDAQGRWNGFISLEDILEEIVGTITDEFEDEPPVTLADVLTPGRVVIGVEAASLTEAVRQLINAVPVTELPRPAAELVRAVGERERLASTYLGRGIALPHARLPGLDRPVLLFGRSIKGVPVEGHKDRVQLVFVLLTPAGQPRIHQRLQARIAGIIAESDYVDDRLRGCTTAAEVLEVVRAGEQAALD